MAALQAAYETLFGATFSTTPVLPFFGVGETVWKKSEFSGSLSTWNKARKYTVADIVLKSIDEEGTIVFVDSTGAEVTNAGAQPGDTTTGFFYVLSDTTVVHESEILGETAMRTYVDGQVNTFIAE